jgi:tetratricopeptide (TPR) repeat protein
VNKRPVVSYLLQIGAATLLVSSLLSMLDSTQSFAQSSTAPTRRPRGAQSQANRGSQALGLQRSRIALPQSAKMKTEIPNHQLGAVKPPRTNDFLDGDSKEVEYEHLVDRTISELYKLSSQNRRSQKRGELWLRLGEGYVEKARLVGFREQAEYDKKLKAFQEKKSHIRPRLDEKLSHEYNQKAVQLYEWFIRDFPKDPKVDQALFFLGYNHFQLGNTKKGEEYYTQLVRDYPESLYVTESHFALGEYYFENEKWQAALDNYVKVIRVKRARLNSFAMYKASWCLYRVSRVPEALKMLERVVRLGKAAEAEEGVAGRKAVNKVRLVKEALKDYVPFYAEVGQPAGAAHEFNRITGDEKQAKAMLERLAYIYGDSGNRSSANFIFKQLISMDPGGEKAAEYQYQVVLAYATSDQKEFRKELEVWLESFGPSSYWAKENAKNPKIVTDMTKLQETTLRNYVLQLHQTAQNTRAEYTQKAAAQAYNLYLKYFADSPQSLEMQYFHAELLFDMGRYEDAARLYTWVADKDPKGPYREKAIINSLLALEKDLPSPHDIEEKRGDSIEKIPLDPPVARFEKAALRYMEALPKGEKVPDIRRRLGVLYYSYNHFEEAIDLFDKIIRDDPKSQNAEIAGNLILDIFNLKGDMVGLADKGQQLLSNPAFARTKFGEKIKGLMEKASYLKAEKIAESGDSGKAAKEFENFAAVYKQSDLVTAARYKAATSYEKVGDLTSAIRLHGQVLLAPGENPKVKAVQNDSRNALARIYQQTGQLELAAKQYQVYAQTNSKDQKAVNAFYNAAILWDSLNETSAAIQNYQNYFDLSKKSDRVEIIFAQAEIYRRKEQLAKAEHYYDLYLKSGPRSEGNALQASFMIGSMAEKRGQHSKAKQWYQKTVELFKHTGKAGREAGVKYAADARFQLAQETLVQLKAVRFGVSDKRQAEGALQVKKLREQYLNEMKDVIRYDYGPFIIAALASSGQMFEDIANLFAGISVPHGFSEADAQKYKELIQGQVTGFRNEAKNSYKAAVDKSVELEAFSPWSKTAQVGLSSLDAAGGGASEIAVDSRAADWMGL